MKYEAPEMKFMGIEADDVIQTSGNNTSTPGGLGGGSELPFNPVSVEDVEETY